MKRGIGLNNKKSTLCVQGIIAIIGIIGFTILGFLAINICFLLHKWPI